MERSEAVQWAFIMGVYAWMMMSDVVFSGNMQVASASKIVSWSLMLLSLFVIEWWCRVAASEYFAIKAIVRPTNKTLNLFINKTGMEKDLSDRRAPNWRITPCPLGKKIKYEPYGEVKQIFIRHQHDFDTRMPGGKGKVNFMGNTVDHSNMVNAVFYEVPESQFVIDHGEPQPTFLLAEGPGDYYLGPMLSTPIIISNNPHGQQATAKLAQLSHDKSKLQSALITERKKSSYWHTKAIEFESAIKGLQEELSGVLKNPLKHMVSVIQYVQHYVTAIGDIEQLAKQGSMWRRIPTQLIYAVIVGCLAVFVLTRQELMMGFGEWMSTGSNQIFLLVIVAMLLVVVYYLFHRRSGKQ